MIQEQNAAPGLANRLLARGATRIYAGMPVADGVFPADKTKVTGNPVRESLLRYSDPKSARRHFGLQEGTPTVLCFGGSLGARGLNRLIGRALASGRARSWQWIWSTGPDHFEAMRASLEGIPEPGRVRVVDYLEEMDLAYAAADLVICRAGALTLAELAVLGKASILVPLPTSAGDHQRANARRFEDRGAARIVEESDPMAGEKIVTCLEQFERDCDNLKALGDAARLGSHPNAAREISGDVLRFLE
jgi:UDP-N-acetylglucosamine--N-acetylmuramyl-(pentapeptide) pyrophosphoryl-undecaprenol N-acetylglucosamine transferase